MGRFRLLAVVMIGVVACGGSSAPPRQPGAAPAPTRDAQAAPGPPAAAPGPAVAARPPVEQAPTCLQVGERFWNWLQAEYRPFGVQIDQKRVVTGMDRVCLQSEWSVESRRCLGQAATYDDWTSCFSTVPNPPPMPPPIPPGPPPPPQNIPPTLLEGSRISGEKNIAPDDDTKLAMQKSGKDRVVGSFKLCLDMAGSIITIRLLKSTGFPAYDEKIQREMNNWRYRAYMVNGKAVPVCTAVTFIYSQVPALPPSPPPPSPSRPAP